MVIYSYKNVDLLIYLYKTFCLYIFIVKKKLNFFYKKIDLCKYYLFFLLSRYDQKNARDT